MTRPSIRSACVAIAVGLVVAGCGAGGTAAADAGFRSSYIGARQRVQAIMAQVQSAVVSTGRHPDVLLATKFTNLGSRVANEGYAVAALSPPVHYNTRVRDLGAALLATANDLDQLATATTQQNTRGVGAAIKTLRRDVRTVQLAQATVSDALGLRAS